MKQLALAVTFAAALGASAALPASAAGDFKNRNIRLSTGFIQDHPVGAGFKAFDQCLQEKSGGKMKVTVYWVSSLGDDVQATQALRSGTQETVLTSTSPLVGLVPALGVFDLPFLFASHEEADAILDGEFGRFIDEKLDAVGVINLAYWENGFRNLSNSRHPVYKWEDFSGLKLRVMQNNIFLDMFRTLGANATPMAFGEVFSALETKAIDGQENPFVTIDSSKFFEVQKYLSLTGHVWGPANLVVSKPVWNRISAADQQVIRAAAATWRDAQRKAISDSDAQFIAKLKEQGMVVNDVDKAAFVAAVAPIWQRYAATFGPALMATLQKYREAQ